MFDINKKKGPNGPFYFCLTSIPIPHTAHNQF